MANSPQGDRWQRWVIVLLLVLLVINSLLLARANNYLNLPGEIGSLEAARHGARQLSEFHENNAKNAGVLANSAVREVLARFRYEVDRATTAEQISKLINEYSLRLRDVIDRERISKQRDTVLGLLGEDEELRSFEGAAIIKVSRVDGEGVQLEDPTGLISEETVEKIEEHPLLSDTWQPIEIEIKDGQLDLITARSLLDSLKMYEDEVATLRSKIKDLQLAGGFAEMRGSGIVVSLHDAAEGYSSVDIVHDRDVRDVVNELYAAGASGVAVGNQRLITTSSIRCVGPIILVNQQPISVNPVEIKAIGDPAVLSSSLDLIKKQLEEFGIRVEIEEKEQIELPVYGQAINRGQ